MANIEDFDFPLRDRLQFSDPQLPNPDAQPKRSFCAYCRQTLYLLPHEFRVCQSSDCIEKAIADRDERIFEIRLSIPQVQAQLAAEKESLLEKITELETNDPNGVALTQYKAVLSSLITNLNFRAKNDRIDEVLALEEQIRELSRRISRPSFSEEFRR